MGLALNEPGSLSLFHLELCNPPLNECTTYQPSASLYDGLMFYHRKVSSKQSTDSHHNKYLNPLLYSFQASASEPEQLAKIQIRADQLIIA